MQTGERIWFIRNGLVETGIIKGFTILNRSATNEFYVDLECPDDINWSIPAKRCYLTKEQADTDCQMQIDKLTRQYTESITTKEELLLFLCNHNVAEPRSYEDRIAIKVAIDKAKELLDVELPSSLIKRGDRYEP